METTSIRHPRNKTQAEAALNIRRGTGQHREVYWHYFKTRDHVDHWDINVKDGNTLAVHVYSGIPFLHVRSGHVTVDFHSSWGNSITVHAGASAHVIVPSASTKVTINVEPGGSYTMDIPEGRNRVYFPEKYDGRYNEALAGGASRDELDAITHENAMQAALANAHKRAGGVVLDRRTTPEGVVIETIPATPLIDEDFDRRRGDGWDASSISD